MMTSPFAPMSAELTVEQIEQVRQIFDLKDCGFGYKRNDLRDKLCDMALAHLRNARAPDTELTRLVEQLDALQDAATPGPWDCHAPDCCGWIDYDDGVICDVKNNQDDLQDASGHAPTALQARANQELICALRNAWPQLSAHLRSQAEGYVSAWIPVSERLPDEGDKILVWNSRNYEADDYARPDWFASKRITHWMPLPSPPAGEGAGKEGK